MGTFDHQFEDLAMDDEVTKPYQFSELKTEPTCFFRPATEDNKPYASALIKISNKSAKKNRNRRGANLDDIDRVRRRNRLLVAKYCLVGWEGMTDKVEKGKDGKPKEIEFNLEHGAEFINALPHWLFDRLYNWLQNPENFLPDNEDEVDDEDDLTLEDLDDLDDGEEPESDSLGKP